jgi:hypothetical protein
MFDSLTIGSFFREKNAEKPDSNEKSTPPSDLSRVIGLINSIKHHAEERLGSSETEWFEDRVSSLIILYDFCHSQDAKQGIVFSELCDVVLQRLASYRRGDSDQIQYVCKDDPDLLLNPEAALMVGLVIDNLMERYADTVNTRGGNATIGLAIRTTPDEKVILSIMELSGRENRSQHYGFQPSILMECLVEDGLGGSLSITDERLAKAVIKLDRSRVEAAFHAPTKNIYHSVKPVQSLRHGAL